MSDRKNETSVNQFENESDQSAQSRKLSKPAQQHQSRLIPAVIILIIGGFGILTYFVLSIPSIPIDLEISHNIQSIQIPFFGQLMALVSWFGFSPQVVVITGSIVLLMYGVGWHWEAVMALVTALFSTALNFIVKELVHRPRPTLNDVNVTALLNSYSFPSGHVMYYVSFFGFIGFLIFRLVQPSARRNLMLFVIWLAILLIGISRIYMGQHWASDVVGAYLLGSLNLYACSHLYQWQKNRFLIRDPMEKT
jgi:membrane-associated phospholipid phosphatase